VPALRTSIPDQLARSISCSLGLPEDAGAVLGALLLQTDRAASLEELEAVLRRPVGRLGVSVDQLRRLGVLERGEQRFKQRLRGTPGLRDLLRQLASAYRKGGMEALEALHWQQREISKPYRRLMRALQQLCPVERLTEFGAALNRDLEQLPLWEASTRAISQLAGRWDVLLPEASRPALASSPLIVYGNHPSMLTPFLVSAALEREDIRVITCRYVEQLVPNIADHLFPVEPAYTRTAREGLKHGLSHLLSMALLYRFDQMPDPVTAKQLNGQSIRAASEHVRSGGVSVIFPGGGGTRRWYPGLGRLISQLLQDPGASEPLLVPIREMHSSNLRLYRLLSGRTGSRSKKSRKLPITLAVGRPQPLSSYAFTDRTSPQEIVKTLRTQFRRTRCEG